MRALPWMVSLMFCWLANSVLSAQGLKEEEYDFPAFRGDSLVIHNDYGRVRITGGAGTEVQVRIRKIAASKSRLDNIQVVSQKLGSKVHIRSFFFEYSAESVYVDVVAPRFMGVMIWGANPGVEVTGIDGFVRVQTITGLITAEDLSASVNLLTESGDILYRQSRQPMHDARLESIRGNVRCFLSESLNFRGWVRSGGTLTWDSGPTLRDESLERQVGVGGPLISASSEHGQVQVTFLDGTARVPVMESATQIDSGPQRTGQSSWEPVAHSETASARTAPEVDEQPPAHRSPPPDLGDRPPSGPLPEGLVDMGYVLSVNVDWIYLSASVSDSRSNRSITDLRRQDFSVYEDGQLQTIEKFERSEAPYHLLLLLDVSGSTAGFIDLIRQASIDFTRQIQPHDRIAVATFNSTVRLVQDFTNDRELVAERIRRIRAGGGTAFYDALHTSVFEYLGRMEGRKAIVVFTDGVDNRLTGQFGSGSRIDYPSLLRRVQESDALIYNIFLDTRDWMNATSRGGSGGGIGGVLADILLGRIPQSRTPSSGSRRSERAAYEEAELQLRAIADQTGGRLYKPRRIEDLGHAYGEIADDLRIQYTLGYTSTNPNKDGRWRSIRVEIEGRPELLIRARQGYYAPQPERSALGTPP